ncbi:MAG: 4Fe-4S binding protein [Spirochaetales bacterium]|nr:4Fe-4S binding protein [Spirochaetales bacterium]
MSKVIMVNVEKCVGCHSCELACALAHTKAGNLAVAIQNGERPGTRIAIEVSGNKPIPLHCHHCEVASCMMVCPSGAIHRKALREPVLVDQEKCIGCHMCVQACPFGMMMISPSGKGVHKCDHCIERLKIGMEPACVIACPTKAVLFVEDSDVSKEKRKHIARCLVLTGGDPSGLTPEGECDE